MPEHLAIAEPPEVWIEKYRRCPNVPQKDPVDMSPEQIRDEILLLLFNESFRKRVGATDRELLTITVLREKAHHFNFLKAYTTWKVVGMWKGEPEEKNVQIDIEFRDNKQECIGARLMHLLSEYNHKVVGEQLLYARTTPLEEGTLFP